MHPKLGAGYFTTPSSTRAAKRGVCERNSAAPKPLPTRTRITAALMADDDAHDDIGIDNGFVQGDDEVLKAAIKAREAQCTPQLLRESPGQALKIALQDPPYNTRTMAVKELSAMVAVKALHAIKDAEASQVRATPPRCPPRSPPRSPPHSPGWHILARVAPPALASRPPPHRGVRQTSPPLHPRAPRPPPPPHISLPSPPRPCQRYGTDGHGPRVLPLPPCPPTMSPHTTPPYTGPPRRLLL